MSSRELLRQIERLMRQMRSDGRPIMHAQLNRGGWYDEREVLVVCDGKPYVLYLSPPPAQPAAMVDARHERWRASGASVSVIREQNDFESLFSHQNGKVDSGASEAPQKRKRGRPRKYPVEA